MIIIKTTKVNARDVSEYAWNRIAQFHNSDFTANAIVALHKLGKKQFPNARKQAEQIKYCLVQAQEYFNSARTVTLATKPVMLYYCSMSLALAEVLLKQTGNSRLSRLRSEHNCHGLTLGLTADPDPIDSFEIAASKLFARVQRKDADHAKGTFEVWRRSAREYPLGGDSTSVLPTGTLSKYDVLLYPEDKAPPELGTSGISLYDCIVNLPYMHDILSRWGTGLQMVRSKISREMNLSNGKTTLVITIQPTLPKLLEKFGDLVKAEPSLINHIEINELSSGYILKIDLSGGSNFSLPHSTCIVDSEVYFACSSVNLGEFGYLYTAFHILGNFARYYPDIWMKHIESSSPLANVADELCRHALDRLPLLTLSELTRSYHVLEK